MSWELHNLLQLCAIAHWKMGHFQTLSPSSSLSSLPHSSSSLSPPTPHPAHSRRLVNVKSRLKQAPRYSSLDRELIEYQERQLFEYFVVVSLHKKQAGASYVPELTQQFPLKVLGGPGLCGLPGDCREVWESEDHLVSRIST